MSIKTNKHEPTCKTSSTRTSSTFFMFFLQNIMVLRMISFNTVDLSAV